LVGQFSGIAKTAMMSAILQAKAIPDQAAFAARQRHSGLRNRHVQSHLRDIAT
jgi:hypothetical protein